MIELNQSNVRVTPTKEEKKVRDYSDLAEALYHAEYNETIWLMNLKTPTQKPKENMKLTRTKDGWELLKVD